MSTSYYIQNIHKTSYVSFRYGDIVFDQSINMNIHDRVESIQNMSALAITGAARDISKTKLYRELGLESLCFRTSFRKLACFYIIKSLGFPTIYLIQFRPPT